jgi:Concanavalin A-like lectin/glucanases superfamily
MALTAVAMTFGDGVRCTPSDEFTSYAYLANIGADTAFNGPTFSLACRFKASAGATPFDSSAAVIRFADNNGSLRRFGLVIQNKDTGNWRILADFNSTACPSQQVVLYTVARDASEHSVVWTYDQDGDSLLYFDGTLVDTRAAPCSDISAPSAADDQFVILGNPNVGPTLFDLDQVLFSDAVMTAGQVTTYDTTGAL